MLKPIRFTLLVAAFFVAIALITPAFAPAGAPPSPYLSALSDAAVGNSTAQACSYRRCYNKGTTKRPNFVCKVTPISMDCDLVSSTECYDISCGPVGP